MSQENSTAESPPDVKEENVRKEILVELNNLGNGSPWLW